MLVDISSYEKEPPDKDAFHIIVICEGKKREVQYFRYFRGISSRLKMVVVPPKDGKTHPKQLWETAIDKVKPEKETKHDEIWVVFDLDHDFEACKVIANESTEENISLGMSNPCFEVWLHYHKKESIPEDLNISICGEWKTHLHKNVFKGGFNSNYHPILIENAIVNTKSNYKSYDGLPKEGHTNLYKLGVKINETIKQKLDQIKND